MMKKVTLSLLFSGLLLSGCSGFFLGTENLAEPSDLPATTGGVAFNRQWKHSVGDGTEEKSLDLVPLATRQAVYAVSADGELASFERTSGKKRWEIQTGQPIAAGVSGNDNLVVVASKDGLLMAFDSNNGQAGWTYQLSTEVLAAPTVISDLVVARAIDGQVVALDARSGQVIWKQDIGVADLSIRGNSRAVFVDGMLLFTNGKGRLTLLSAVDGQPVFTAPIVLGKGKTEVDRIADLMATPVVHNGILLLSAYRHQTMAINLKDGGLLWKSPLSTALDLFADNRYVYVADKNSIIYALDITTGNRVWQSDALKGRRISPLSGNGDWITTVDFDGVLNVLSTDDGRVLGSYSIGDERTYVAPRYLPNGWLTYTGDGTLSMTEINPR